MINQAQAQHTLHAIPRNPVQAQLLTVAHVTRALPVERRRYYDDALRGIESRVAAGRITDTEAVSLLQRLGEQAYQERG